MKTWMYLKAGLMAGSIVLSLGTAALAGNVSSGGNSQGVSKGDLVAGVNYPGLGIRYFPGNNIAFEGKAQSEDKVGVYGLRGYYYFNPKAVLMLFSGLELDYTAFSGEQSKGKGFAASVFVGGEYYVSKRFSFQMDLGPALVSIRDDATSESVTGTEYVVNFGINYHFGR